MTQTELVLENSQLMCENIALKDEILALKHGRTQSSVNLKYVASDYKPTKVEWSGICQTLEQFNLFADFLSSMQKLQMP